jgi:uncharacterized membrane protein YphA (DoxX/SURF4 family)
MLNTFPNLLTYGFFAPAILRVLVALSFFYIAYAQASRRKEIAELKIQIIGHVDQTMVLISSLAIAATGLALFLGWHTQIAAIVGILVALKHAIYAKKYPRLIPLCRLEYIYLLVILLTLLISGAGAFAMDVPL